MSRHYASLALVLSLTAAAVAEDPQAFDQLHLSWQRAATQFSVDCIKIGDDYWLDFSENAEHHKLRLDRRFGDEEKYRVVEGVTPTAVCLRTHAVSASIEAAVEAEQDKRLDMAAPGAITLRRRVLQVLDDGLLLDGGSPTFLEMSDARGKGYIDGSLVESLAKRQGSYSYISTLGAQRTVAKYVEVELTQQQIAYCLVKPSPADTEDLYEYLHRNKITDYPAIVPRAEVVAGPEYRTSSTRISGGVSRRSRSISKPGDVQFVSDFVMTPLRFIRIEGVESPSPNPEDTGLRNSLDAMVGRLPGRQLPVPR